jgi:hypothetical protein
VGVKIAILFTAYRQLPELDVIADLFGRAPRISSSVDVVYHCNNAGIATGAVQEKLDRVPCKSRTLIHQPTNKGGYAYGQFEAICDAWETMIAGGWDWVIHVHPDVFIVDENKLLGVIEQADAAGAGGVFAHMAGNKHPSYSTDFFAFRPTAVPKAVFQSYECLLDEPVIVPLENLFFMEIHRVGVKPFVTQRFLSGQYHQDLDLIGLWHEHDLQRVRLFMEKPSKRWRRTVVRTMKRPGATAWAALSWLRRWRAGVKQDGLPKYLTMV